MTLFTITQLQSRLNLVLAWQPRPPDVKDSGFRTACFKRSD